jgi:hypothetical protein
MWPTFNLIKEARSTRQAIVQSSGYYRNSFVISGAIYSVEVSKLHSFLGN